MLNILAHPVSFFYRIISYTGKLTILFVNTVRLIFVPPFNTERFLQQAKKIGPESFFITSLVAFFVGMIIALQMAYLMVALSAEIYIPNVVALSLTRELAPVLSSLIVAGRVGSGITAEIGSMTVTDQVAALRSFAINPVQYLVVPRFLGLVVMLPILTVFADIIGIMGGFVISVFKLHISPSMYMTMVFDALAVKDVVTGLIKTISFGVIIAIVGCYEGLVVKGGAEGVGQATTISVVRSFILIIACDCMFTTMFYFVFNA